MAPRESPRPKSGERGHHKHRSDGRSPRKPTSNGTSSKTSSQALSFDALAKLDQINQRGVTIQDEAPRKTRRKPNEGTPTKPRRRPEEEIPTKSRRKPDETPTKTRQIIYETPTKSPNRRSDDPLIPKTRRKEERQRELIDEKIIINKSRKSQKRAKRRIVSGALLEEGNGEKLRGLRGLRGGKGGSSDDSDAPPNRKRLCRIYSLRPTLYLTCE